MLVTAKRDTSGHLPQDFEKALKALLDTPAPPKNLGRPKAKM